MSRIENVRRLCQPQSLRIAYASVCCVILRLMTAYPADIQHRLIIVDHSRLSFAQLKLAGYLSKSAARASICSVAVETVASNFCTSWLLFEKAS